MTSKRFGIALLALSGLVLATSPLPAQVPDEISPQQLLMARRAAELDAYRQMTETLYGMKLSSRTTVRNFITENDAIETAFDHFIKGIRVLGTPVYLADGSCEITVSTTVERVVQELQEIRQRHYHGSSFHDHTFRKLVDRTEIQTLTATGYGAPTDAPTANGGNPVAPPQYPDEIVPPRGFPENPEFQFVAAPTAGMPRWRGVTGQGRLLAFSSARADGIRKLTEAIHGVQITSETKVSDFVAASDEIRTDLENFTRGIGVVGAPRFNSLGICEVDMAVTLAEVVEEIKRIRQRRRVGPRIEEREIIKQHQFTKERVVQVTGSGGPRANTVLAGTRFVGWDQVNPRMKLMARRAAVAVAYRNLAERVKGLQITSSSRVTDMVTDSDLINIVSEHALKGMSEEGETWWYDDGSVQVTFRIPHQVVVEEVFKVIHKGHGPQPPPQKEVQTTQTTIWIVENGYGALPARAPFYVPDGSPASAAPPAPGWSVESFTVTGAGVPPQDAGSPAQARLLAERAAETDAQRRLLEQIGGVRINAETTVADFIAERDTIRTEVEGVLRGARKVAVRELDDGTVEVDVTLDLAPLWKLVEDQA